MQARLALRLMPKMSFGLGYSKGIRWAQYSGKVTRVTKTEHAFDSDKDLISGRVGFGTDLRPLNLKVLSLSHIVRTS